MDLWSEDETEDTKNEGDNATILLRERYDLLKWTSNVELKTPNLMIPVQIANYVESLPFCKFAISPKCDRVSLMSYDRLLDIYTINGELLEHESSVQVLEETSPEYCLLQFTSSGSLILSSRSTPHIDVFDNMGAYCYDIALDSHEGIFDVSSAICAMQTVPNNYASSNDKFLEILYVLQYSGKFSAFKIGRLSKFARMWSIDLDIGQTGSFVVLPQYNLLLVASHYTESTSVNPPAGLCSYRMTDSEPYLEPIRISTPDGGWFSRLPFSTSSMSYLPKMSLSHDSQLLVSVSTSGSLYIFEVPSIHVRFTFNYLNGPKPIEACFVDSEEIAIIYDTGVLLRCSLEDIEEKMHSMKKAGKDYLDDQNDQKDIYSGQTIMVTPAAREIFLLSAEGDSTVLREAAHKRVQLAGQLWFYTVWNSFKKLVGMAMGESAEPLQMATHLARFDFNLVHSPTRTLEELFNRTLVEHDYSRARELAESYNTIDIDVVLKSEWINKCSKNQLTTDDVMKTLGKIRDIEWVAEQCVNVEVEDLEVQKALIDLGLSLTSSSINWKIRLLHHLRLLEVCQVNNDIEVFLRGRNRSCLDAALTFANKGDMESLLRIVESNMMIMKMHHKRILSAIPSCIYPTKYEHFFPKFENGKYAQWELDEGQSKVLDRLNELLIENPDAAILVKNVNVGDTADEEPIDFVEWVRENLKKIDFECGMTSNCISLLSIAIERGFEELEEDVSKWKLYLLYTNICSSVSESIISFEDSTVKSFIDRFSRLLEYELIANSSSIMSLIEWKITSCTEKSEHAQNIREAMISLMTNTNERTTRVLVAFREKRPDLIDDQVILECLLNMTSTGADLLQSIGSLSVDKYSNVTSSLSSLMSRGVKMTFKSIFESMREPDGAKRVLIKLSRSGHCEKLEEWCSLRDDIVDMAQGIYGDLITLEEALELIAGEILENERIGQQPELMSLVLTMNKDEPENERKLSLLKSAEVLLSKSDELMSEATHKDDPLLGKSRFFAVAARSISPEGAEEKLKWLDTIELAQELGCTMMPIAIKLSDHDVLLHDIVHNGTNYTLGKKLAKLAVLLSIDTPVATALSYCALAALNANDATYLSRYIGEVISKARGLPVVHHLCMKIMESKHVPTDMGDIYACAMMNCSEENLLATVDAIAESEKRINEARRTKVIHSNDIPVIDEFVHDPMYSPIEVYKTKKPSDLEIEKLMKKTRKTGKGLGIREMKHITANESSSLALFFSLLELKNKTETEDNISEEEDDWTNNDKLKRYEKSLRHFMKKYPLGFLVNVPPSNVIHAANLNDQTITPIDRIEDYGCNRNRFIQDQQYREDAIVGLAMTENEQQFEDAIELAKKYNIDEWQLHMTSLENALSSLSISEVKRIIKQRGHLANLRTRSEEFHSTLRSSVLPLLGTNEQFIAYTSLFGENEAEKKVSPVIKKIIEKRKDVKATKMWGDAKYLSGVLVSVPDKVLWSIIDNILLIPVGKQACEMTARILLDGNDVRPPAHPLTLFILLGRDTEEFLELVAVKTREEEIEYLDRAILLLEATPSSPPSLVNSIKERVDRMRRSTATPEPSTDSSANGSFGSFGSFGSVAFSNNDSSGMMKRRKN